MWSGYLLTFCPPGPLLRENVTLQRSFGILDGVKCSIQMCSRFISSSRATNFDLRVGFFLSTLA